MRANVVAPGRIATKRVRATYSDAEWEAAAKEFPSATLENRRTSPKPWPFSPAMPADT